MTAFNKVFIVTPNANDFAILQESALEMSLQVTTNEPIQLYGESVKDSWRSIDIEWLDVEGENTLPRPDVAAWGAVTFAVPAAIADKLGALSENVEFLPLSLKGQPWRALNIITQIDAIDRSATEYNLRNGKPSRTRPFKKLVLNREAINEAGLFRVKGAGLRTFCTDKKGGLYDRVKELNLTGLDFKEVLVSS
ncbi:hypothetical protein P3551_22220 [Vibrio parahaemolyticus]|nr:hypothetical protein [Vibrio parahaemolyticus]MBE4367897.1 hypothetical protein [Vibrio parahaemolyticus]MBM4919188.1 hypothetical protein [Vibrio parahaemolyticus]MBM4977838.1 hypothetical protein [Vibrio parahaemolyticus]MDF4902002.1 hypothetical protein [Vibrio parahaemolyticus]